MTYAPIALFVYNRLNYLKKTVEFLKANHLALESDLIIFSDGSKDKEDEFKVRELRQYLRTIEGFKSLRIVESKTNRGLAPSLISGITEVLDEYGKIIVFEDDIISSQHTLSFLNNCLEIYKESENVGMVHAHVETIKEQLPPLFFLMRGGCWGWATWKRAWDKVNFDGQYLYKQIQIRSLQHRFDLDGSYPYMKMLENCIKGKNSSWSIRVDASFLLHEMLTLYPGKSYTQHIGYEGGTHIKAGSFATEFDGRIDAVKDVAAEIEVREQIKIRNIFVKFYKKRRKYSLWFFKTELKKRIRYYYNKFRK